VGAGVLISQLRDVGPRELARDAWFQVAMLIAVVGTGTFYAGAAILSLERPKAFGKSERGVYIARFARDHDESVQVKTFEVVRGELFSRKAPKDIKIVQLPRTVADSEAATRLLSASNARVVVWGTFLTPDDVYYTVTTAPDGTELQVSAKFSDMKPLSSTLCDYLESTPPAEAASQGDQLAFLKKQVESLEQQRDELLARQAGVPRRELTGSLENRSQTVITIGIDHYMKTVPPQRFAVSDAEAVSKFFQGRMNARVVGLRNEAATRVGVLNALEEVGANSAKDDSIILFFSGAGGGGANNSYLVPFDGDPEHPDATMISLADIFNWSNRLAVPQVVILLDTTVGLVQTLEREDPRAQSNSKTMSEAARAILASEGDSEHAIELSRVGQSVFTYYLLQGLSGEADFNNDGIITFNELRTYIDYRLAEVSAQFGLRQRPVSSVTGLGDPVIVVLAKK
jgi:hypothetical protein